MKKIVLKSVSFIIVFVLVFQLVEGFFYKESQKETVWQSIQNGKQYDILFMGNSHAFCNVNPIVINEALGLETALLGSSAQPMELTYENLKLLLNYTKPNMIVLESNVLTKRPEDMIESEKQGFLYDNIDQINKLSDRAKMSLHTLDRDHWLEATSKLFRPMFTWTRWEEKENQDVSTNCNTKVGYVAKSGISDFEKNIVEKTQEAHIKGAGEQTSEETMDTYVYLRKFLDLTEKNDIPVYIIKAPVIEQAGHASIISLVEQISKEYANVVDVHNFNEDLIDMGIDRYDYYDAGHLNRIGAQKFTEYLIKYFEKHMNLKANYSNVAYYRNESAEVSPEDESLYRYTIDTYPNTLVRFKVMDEKGNVLQQTDFSEEKYIDIPKIGTENVAKLYFILKQKSGEVTYSIEEMRYEFIKNAE